MSRLILLVGPPGSGKSTLAKKLIETDYPEAVYVNQDSQGKEGHMTAFLEAIRSGKPVIVDRMNFSKEQRERYLSVARYNLYDTEIRVLHVPKSECLRRCADRTGQPAMF